MKIQTADFVISAASPRQFPPPLLPEVAFAGKSNVGKSSLINSLLNRKNLVKTSGTPGKTRLINFFKINGHFHLVDLPGYGFARVAREVKDEWEALVSAYLMERPGLRGVVMIVDSRHGPTGLDGQMKSLLEGAGLPYLVVANKADKLGRSALGTQLREIATVLALPSAPMAYSAQKHTGRPELWAQLEDWLASRE